MKKIFFLLIFCCSFFLSEAKIITVSNNTNSPGQYTSLQAAINASLAGDSIYVHGSATSYGNVTVNKQLTFIGTGHNPKKSIPLVSEIGNIQLDILANTSDASGTRIIGFKLSGVFGYTGGGGTKNILIARNSFGSSGSQIYITGSGWKIENNVLNFQYINLNNNANITIQNNIFSTTYIAYSNKPSVLIVNNIFLGITPATALYTVTNANIANNIFSGSSPKGTSIDNNVFSNNITYHTAYDTIPFGTNLGSGNFVAKNPQFTNVPANAFNYNYDFSLKSTSPGKNAGTDGKDIGIYGGTASFPDLTGSPAIPQIKSLSILNPVIPVGDSLKVVIKAKKQN